MRDYQLFVDLDGVLADFDAGVRRATGKEPSELHPGRMWPILARTPGFYADLSWMDDGLELWDAVKGFSPVILTGLPRGRWAEPQKRAWCARELGESVPVITCFSARKAERAGEWMEERGLEGKTPVLVDDRLKLKESWEEAGGTFILHLSAEGSLGELGRLGFDI